MNTGTIDLLGNNIDLEIDGVRVANIDVPSDYVAHTFAPILGTHHLLTGDKLKNGMIVVLGDRSSRENPNVLSPENPDRARGFVPSEYDRARVEETSRWALVTDLKIVSNGPDSRISKFTAIYSDGTMRDRTYNVSYKWAVLKDFDAGVLCPNCGEVHRTDEGVVSSASEFPEFLSAALDMVLGGLTGNFLDRIIAGLNEEEDEDAHPDTEARQPGESDDEYFERRRDEEERRNEYDADEALKLLREKLTGRPRQQ